ncbi:DUF3570 domain-containing protein [Methyloglobulus sp.]|uniref:DUF3570 domain-containing protein n=1 Tax=Methyloglobulus sp. TaxID=2518622 RepID=UPI0032B7DFAB
MGVIKKFRGRTGGNDGIGLSLKALTTAALILPGLFYPNAQAAEDDEVDFQYSHYQEGKRDILESETTRKNNANPIEVESIHGGAKISLTDRIKIAFNYTQDTWGGATPIDSGPFVAGANGAIKTIGIEEIDSIGAASPLISHRVFFDKNLTPYKQILKDGQFIHVPDKRIVHTLAIASPETRKQGDFKLGYEWDNAAIDIGGGISLEDDYESRFGNLNGRLDFNEKQTTVNLGLSYTNSDIDAILDHDIGSYGNESNFNQYIQVIDEETNTKKIIGNRQDWGANLGLTQVLNKSASLNAGMSYTRSTGMLENPYKRVEYFFIDPDQTPNSEGLLQGGSNAYIEQRPHERNQWNWNLGYSQYVQPLDAALHVNYQFFHDDWGINAHTFEGDWVQPLGAGWTVTPRIRYYSQEAADFYQPYFFSFNKRPSRRDEFDPALLQQNYSSDQRLSGFGTLSGGVTVAKQFAKGLSLEAGFEYYTHQGGLKIGGGGEQDFADFDYWTANAALKINLAALGRDASGSDGGNFHNHHTSHANAPAGVMVAHTLDKAGDIMLGYRYMWNNQDGNMLHQDSAVSLANLQNKGCFSGQGHFNTCLAAPKSMAMHMHMLDLMVAPTDWLTLMLMPQFVNMDMSLRGTPAFTGGGNLAHHIANGHETGGIGDTGMYGLFKLWDNPSHKVNLGLGFSAPTGDVDIQLRRAHHQDGGFVHYNMQLGSGTWDFKPSLTYTGKTDKFSWGAQVSGTKRMESSNKSGFALGDMFQGTAWGGYDLTNWLSASVRGVYTWQGRTKGEYPRNKIDFVPTPEAEACPNESFIIDDGNGNISIDQVGFNQCIVEIRNANKEGLKAAIYTDDATYRSNPADLPSNSGGQYVDLGLGLNVNIPDGAFAGNRLAFEWLQPVYTRQTGYQLDRDGALSFTWSYGF